MKWNNFEANNFGARQQILGGPFQLAWRASAFPVDRKHYSLLQKKGKEIENEKRKKQKLEHAITYCSLQSKL